MFGVERPLLWESMGDGSVGFSIFPVPFKR
jgi:hypothetical protein